MITKNFSQLCRHDLGVVMRCVAVGRVKNEPYVIAGCIDCNLYIFDKNCTLIQKVTFGNWVRCCAMEDIDGDGDAEILAGSGDKTVKILKRIGETFQEIRSLDFPHIVNACAIADVTGDGIPEILVGTWGSVVYALDSRQYNILWQKEFRGWINFICPGDVTGSGRTDLLVGTRDGMFYVVEGMDGHIIWDYTFPKEINAAAIADVDNSGVPSILVGGNSETLTIFNSQGNNLREIPIQERVLSMAIGDIDGDHANEIVLGCGDNTLRVLENRTHSLEGISLKWRGNFENTIRGIQIHDILGNGVKHIIFGGYNKIIQAIQDFHWGKKPTIESYPVPLAIASTGAQAIEPESQPFLADKIINIEDLLANSPQELADLRAQKPEPRIGEQSEKIVTPYDLLDKIITTKDIEVAEEARRMPRVPSALTPKMTPQPIKPSVKPVISPVTSQPVVEQVTKPVISPVAALPVQPVSTPVATPVVSSGTQAPSGFLGQYCDQVVLHLKQVGIITSKAKLVESIKSIGVPEDAAGQVITKLLEDQRLAYSRTAPRGYGLIGVTPIAPVQAIKAVKKAKPAKRAKPAKIPVVAPAPVATGAPVVVGDQVEVTRKAIDALSTAGIATSKAAVFQLWTKAGIPVEMHEQLLESFKVEGKVVYSKTAPRGYKIKLPGTTSQAPRVPEKVVETGPVPDLTGEVERAYALLKTKGIIPSKPELAKVLEDAGIAGNLVESIINNLKESGRIKYSRATPRGYSAV